MWLKIIYFVATLCVVNASVITVNVFNDEPERTEPQSAEACNWQACDQLCRRLGFPSGVCVNGRCKCDNFKNAEDQIDSLTQEGAEACNWQACDQLCRRLGFPSGVCVNGRCKCDNFRRAEEEYWAPRSCNPQECNQRCRRLKFPGGACVNGRCKCDNFRNAGAISRASGCNYRICNQQCQRRGYAGGVCINDHCKCKKVEHIKAPFAVSEAGAVEPGMDVSDYSRVRNCNLKVCNTICRLLRYKSGTCVSGKCQCSSAEDVTNSTTQKPATVRMEEPTTVENTSNNEVEQSNLILNEEENHEDAGSRLEQLVSPRGCNFYECEKYCSRRGFRPVCSNGRCQCLTNKSGKMISEENTTANEVEVSNQILNEDDRVRDIVGDAETYEREVCNMWACNQRCRTMGFRGGMCLDNVCKCNNLP